MGEETGFGVDNRSSDTFCHYFTEDTKSQKRGLKVLAPGTQGKILESRGFIVSITPIPTNLPSGRWGPGLGKASTKRRRTRVAY